jgi:hypothetical protein
MVRLSAPRTGRLHPQEMFLVLIFTRGWVDPRAMVRSEGNMSLINPVTPLGIDPGAVRLVAQRLNHYATPHYLFTKRKLREARFTELLLLNYSTYAFYHVHFLTDFSGIRYKSRPRMSPFILQPALRSDFSTQCDLLQALSSSSILSFP